MATSKKFGTFEGVFTPTILTILGAIMYLRLGWVVGNAGFGGALVIILLAKLVTVTTGLAIASMASNIKIGPGGSYAIISRSWVWKLAVLLAFHFICLKRWGAPCTS